MKSSINILILEQDPKALALLREAIKQDSEAYALVVVQSREAYCDALGCGLPDAILAGGTAELDAKAAFHIRQALSPETPFILVADASGEEDALTGLQTGMTDYVLLDKVDLLKLKLNRALQEAAVRRQLQTAERKLQRKEEQLRQILDLGQDLLCTLDEHERVVSIDGTAMPFLGYSPETLTGTPLMNLVYPEDREKTCHALHHLKNGVETIHLENRCIGTDGRLVYLRWSLRWDPVSKTASAIARDITEITKAAEKVQHQEQRFQKLLQNNQEGLTLLAADGTVLERSLSAYQILGIDPGDDATTSIREQILPEDLSAIAKAFQQVKKRPSSRLTNTYRLVLPDGSYKWLETTWHNLLEDPAVGAIVLNFRDITNSRKSEIALQKSEARLKEAQAIGHLGYWETNWATGKTQWSDELYHLFGIDKLEPSRDTYISFIHPDDRSAVLAKLKMACDTLQKEGMTFRLLLAGGQVRYVSSEVHFELDDHGQPIRLFGIHQDVTARRQTELALEKSEQKYRNLFELSPTPKWVYAEDTLQFLDVNEAAIKHYGYSKAEFLAMTVPEFQATGQSGMVRNKAHMVSATEEDYIRLQKRNGELVEVELTNSQIDIEGRPARLVIAADISERAKYIRAIKRQNMKLKEIAWIQSHVVRAPLARLMGLIDLLQHAPEQEQAGLFHHLFDSARELDAIIKEIVRKTEQVQGYPGAIEQLI